MNHTIFNRIAVTFLILLCSAAVEAQDFISADGPMNCTITRPRPVYTTQLRPQQVTVFRDVAETQMTQQRVVENVPVTTCKNVTVDEGHYQTVWVPNPVTRQVAQTVVQQRVKTVDVPIQVRRRIPQTATTMVPVQTVQYVNETVPVRMTSMASSCSSCGGGPSVYAPMPSIGTTAPFQSAYAVGSDVPAYASAPIPSMPAIDMPQTPYASSSSARRESSVPLPSMTEETVRPRNRPSKSDDGTFIPQKTSMNQGVPAAASVWRRQDASQMK